MCLSMRAGRQACGAWRNRDNSTNHSTGAGASERPRIAVLGRWGVGLAEDTFAQGPSPCPGNSRIRVLDPRKTDLRD